MYIDINKLLLKMNADTYFKPDMSVHLTYSP